MTPTDTLSQTETVTFRAVRTGLRLVRKGKHPIRNSAGDRVGMTEGITYEFATGDTPGDLTFRPGQDPVDDGPVDEDGKPTVQDAISWLRSHKEYNATGGFHELGKAPGQIPDSGPVLADIAAAAAAGDREVLEAIESTEMGAEGFGRTDVITTARAALAALEPPPAA